MYTIVLHDGTHIDGLTLNGNNFISDTVIDSAVFIGNLETVTFMHGDVTVTYEDMVLLANRVYDGKSWFALGEKTDQQKREEAFARRIRELEAALAGSVGWDELAAAIQEGVDSV